MSLKCEIYSYYMARFCALSNFEFQYSSYHMVYKFTMKSNWAHQKQYVNRLTFMFFESLNENENSIFSQKTVCFLNRKLSVKIVP